jgi:hypothetical protein
MRTTEHLELLHSVVTTVVESTDARDTRIAHVGKVRSHSAGQSVTDEFAIVFREEDGSHTVINIVREPTSTLEDVLHDDSEVK